MTTPTPRVCMWCSQRHTGPPCPDGLVICCHCYDRFPFDQLHETADGELEDVCIPCAEHEAAEMARRGLA